MSDAALPPSVYTVEVNPWVTDSELRDALLLRGAIVSGWAQVESILSEIAVRSSYLDEYRALRSGFPYRLNQRLAYLRRVLDAPGPFARHSPLGRRLLRRFEASATIRHSMAHGRMRQLPHWGWTFQEFRPAPGGVVTHATHRFQRADLVAAATQATRLSRAAQAVLAYLDRQPWLPTLHAIAEAGRKATMSSGSQPSGAAS